MLVPSTFTGWDKKIIITIARPRASKRSRVQARNSRGREKVCPAPAAAGSLAPTTGTLVTVDAKFVGVACGCSSARGIESLMRFLLYHACSRRANLFCFAIWFDIDNSGLLR